jgi:hypothetical protein
MGSFEASHRMIENLQNEICGERVRDLYVLSLGHIER